MKIHLCMYFFFFLLTHSHTQFVQPWQTCTDLWLFPFSRCPASPSSVPPGCSSGFEAKMCRTWANCVSVCVSFCLSAEGMSHISVERLEASTQIALCFISMSEEVKKYETSCLGTVTLSGADSF